MNNICIICPYDYPIPAVKGGAIEQVVDGICTINEIEHLLNITVLTTFDDEAQKLGDHYKYSKFVIFKKYKIDKFIFFVFRVLKKIFKIYIPTSYRMTKIKKWIVENEHNFDFFIFEDGLTYMIPYLFKNIDRKKVLTHLHWIGDPNKKTNKYFSYLLPVSNYVGENWNKQSGASKVPMKILKNGINLDNFTKDLAADEQLVLKRSLGIKDDSFVVLYIGRIVKEKGILRLIEAIERLDEEDITLIIIGSAKFAEKSMTDYEKEVYKRIETSHCLIVHLGFVQNSELYRYQKISDIAIIPTIVEEAAPLVSIECMAAGLPLIATNSGGLPEYADTSCSIIVSKGESMIDELITAIKCLKSDKQLKEKMSNNAVKEAQKYSLKNTYFDLVHFLSKLT